MSIRRSLTVIVLFGFLLSYFSGSQPIRAVAAETVGPPILSTEGLRLVEEPNDGLEQPHVDPLSDPDSNSINSDFVAKMYWNGDIVTRQWVGYKGNWVSEVQHTTLGLNSGGFQSKFPDHRMADDFTIHNGLGWQVDTVTFYAYHYDLSEPPPYPPVSTMTGVYLQIWNDRPGLPDSQIIFGDMTTNRMIHTSWTGIYRVPDTALTDQKRPIMLIEAYVGKFLGPGTYWLEWAITSTGDSNYEPMTVPVTVVGQTTTGNAYHSMDAGANWQPALDSSSTIIPQPQQGMPFLIRGVPGGWTEWYWKSIAPINDLGRMHGAAEAVDGRVYLIGGTVPSGSVVTGSVQTYDPGTNTWETLDDSMPTPASSICTANLHNKIYVAGGQNKVFDAIDTLQVYDTTTNTWEPLNADPLPKALRDAGCAALNGKLYVFGGYDSAGYQSATYVYDPEAESGKRWVTLEESVLSTPRAYLAAAVVGGKIYAVGGMNFTSDDLSSVEVFDPEVGLWHAMPNMLLPRSGPGAYGVGSTLTVCGGGWHTSIRFCETYDTTQGYEGTWQEGPAHMIEGRRNFAYTNIGPVLFAIGGYNNTYLTTAERWSFDVYLPTIMR